MNIAWKVIIGVLTANVCLLSYKMMKVEENVKEIKDTVEDIKTVIVYNQKQVKFSPKEKECLAKNIFNEAGVEPFIGKVAVGHVTINRLQTKRWGTDLCKVVYARKQFSWTNIPKRRNKKPVGKLWEESVIAANEVESGARISTLDDSTLWYHTDYIRPPSWSDSKYTTDKIGQHIFFNKVKTL